jgi:hypothetical protein
MCRLIANYLSLVIAIGLVVTACSQASPTPSPSPASSAPSIMPASTAPSSSPPALIEQPPTPEGLAVAPDSARVDLAMPTFTDPTNVTNSLFPVSAQRSVLLVGEVDGEPFRTEVTLLPDTRIIVSENRFPTS